MRLAVFRLGSFFVRVGVILLTCLVACWVSLVVGVGTGAVKDYQYEIDAIREQRVQALIETRIEDDAEPFRLAGDSMLKFAEQSSQTAWAVAQEARQSLIDSVYYSKSAFRRFREHMVFGFGSSLVGYGGVCDGGSLGIQGEMLMSENVTVRPQRTSASDAVGLSNGLMLLGETFGKYFFSILACIVVAASLRKIEWGLLRLVIAVLVAFAFESWRNTGYATEVQLLLTAHSQGVGLVLGSPLHLFTFYLPIAGVGILLLPSVKSFGPTTTAQVEHEVDLAEDTVWEELKEWPSDSTNPTQSAKDSGAESS